MLTRFKHKTRHPKALFSHVIPQDSLVLNPKYLVCRNLNHIIWVSCGFNGNIRHPG